MDLGWKGEMVSGARVYDVETWRHGVLVVTVCAILGAASCWWIKETRCRNIWQPAFGDLHAFQRKGAEKKHNKINVLCDQPLSLCVGLCGRRLI